jgi:hypothetical protein
MINNIRIDYSGPDRNLDLDKLADFVGQVQELLTDIDEEINDQEGTLVVKVYDGKRMSYLFENISPITAAKANKLARF